MGVSIKEVKREIQKNFRTRTDNQTKCVISISENVITFITGPSGTGKTAISCALASQYLCDNKIKKILITRPMIQCGRKGGGLGYLKGTLEDKFAPYVKPITEELETYLGKKELRTYIHDDVVEVLPIELARGRSLENTIIILDEAQNCTFEQLLNVATRLGKKSKLIVTGDNDQIDLPPYESGLEEFMKINEKDSEIGYCKLDSSDNQREAIVARITDRVKIRNKQKAANL